MIKFRNVPITALQIISDIITESGYKIVVEKSEDHCSYDISVLTKGDEVNER